MLTARLLFTALLPAALLAVPVRAQAPIERRPPPVAVLPTLPSAPTPAEAQSEKQWQRLNTRARRGLAEELRVQANGEPLRCTLDGLTGSDLYCTEYRAFSSPVSRAFYPSQTFRVPRSEIREIRDGGRELSTLVGAAAGFGAGFGLGSINSTDRSEGSAVIAGLLLGLLGAGIGHLAPFKGHVIYRQP